MKPVPGTSVFLATVAALLATSAQASPPASSKWPSATAGQPTPTVAGIPPGLATNLANFDDLDFRVYTDQQWQDLHKSHTKDVIVHWPDGHTTQGIEKHIEDLKYMWTFHPTTGSRTSRPVRNPGRRMDCGYGLAGGHFHQTDGSPGRKNHPAHGQGLRSRWRPSAIGTRTASCSRSSCSGITASS